MTRGAPRRSSRRSCVTLIVEDDPIAVSARRSAAVEHEVRGDGVGGVRAEHERVVVVVAVERDGLCVQRGDPLFTGATLTVSSPSPPLIVTGDRIRPTPLLTCTLTVSLPPAMNIDHRRTGRKLAQVDGFGGRGADEVHRSVPQADHRHVRSPPSLHRRSALRRTHRLTRPSSSRPARANPNAEVVVPIGRAMSFDRVLPSPPAIVIGTLFGFEKTRTKSLPSPVLTLMRLTLAIGKLLMISSTDRCPPVIAGVDDHLQIAAVGTDVDHIVAGDW